MGSIGNPEFADALKHPSNKLTSWLQGRWVRLWGEFRYLRNLLQNPEINRWDKGYVSLQAIRGRSNNLKKAPTGPLITLIEKHTKAGQQIVVLGEPGSGKTATLFALTYRFARKAFEGQIACWRAMLSILGIVSLGAYSLWNASQIRAENAILIPLSCAAAGILVLEVIFRRWPLPILVELRRYHGGAVEQFLKEVVAGNIGGSPIARNLRTYIESGRIIWLLDGVNEIKQAAYVEAIEQWRGCLMPGQYFTRAPLVFTSRAGKEDPSGSIGIKEVITVLELDDTGVHKYLETYGSDWVERDFDILKTKGMLAEGGLGRNPYWLKMLVESGFRTNNRGKLFEGFARRLLERELHKEAQKGGAPPPNRIDIESELELLAELALYMNDAREVGLSFHQAKSVLRNLLTERKVDCTVDEILTQAQAATIMRISEREDRAEFIHQLMQEFFAAYALRLYPGPAFNHLDDPWWWETLLILGALVKDHTAFTQAVLGDGASASRILLAMAVSRSIENSHRDLEWQVRNRMAESLRSGITKEHRRAALVLFRSVGEEFADAVGALLQNPERRVKEGAIALLAAFKSVRSCELLIGAFEDESIAQLAQNALINIEESAVTPLVECLDRTSEKKTVRLYAAEALVHIGGTLAIEAVLRIARPGFFTEDRSDRSYMWRFPDIGSLEWSAMAGLAKIGRSEAIDAFIKLVQRGDHDNRGGAALEILNTAGKPAAGALANVLSNRDNHGRDRVARALADIGGDLAMRALESAYDDPNLFVRQIARQHVSTSRRSFPNKR